MERKKQLMCLILALSVMLSCVMSTLIVNAAEYTFQLMDSAEYALSSGSSISKGEEVTFDTEADSEIELPVAKKDGFGFDGWTYDSGVVSYDGAKTKKIDSAWATGRISAYQTNEILYPVFGRTVKWNFQNGDAERPSYSEFVLGKIDTHGETLFVLSDMYLSVSEKSMTDFGGEEIKKANHVFSHWSDEENGSNDVFDNSEGKYKFGTESGITSDTVNLYAIWKEAPKFNPNGGAWEGDTDSVYGTLGGDGKYTVDAPTYKYRIFKGWFETQYECDAVPNDAVAASEFELDKTYYAGWEAKKYGLEYVNVSEDAENRNPTVYTKVEAEKRAIELIDAEKEGYAFEGWFATNDNDGTTVTDKVEKITDTSTGYDSWKLFATWSYKLKDKKITGRVGTEITPVTLKLEDESLSSVTFTLASGSSLPEGLVLEDGVISGTPSKAESGSVKLEVSTERADGLVILGPTVTFEIKNESSGNTSSTRRYTVMFETNGGTEIANQRVIRNSKVIEPKAPEKDGFEFEGWYTDREFNDKYDFSSKVIKSFTLYAKWNEENDNGKSDEGNNDNSEDGINNNGKNEGNEEGNGENKDNGENPFDDVSEDDWFYEDVIYVNNNGLMVGVSSGSFAPKKLITRAMFVTVLYRLEGSPDVEKNIKFADVAPDAYYANAVVWASDNGIIYGVSATEFAPNNNIKREQIAAIMLRYAKHKNSDLAEDWQKELSYRDADKISEYAVSGVKYCTFNGIMHGKGYNTFAPSDGATRAEVAAVLKRYIELNK